jgi:hypothetical protein
MRNLYKAFLDLIPDPALQVGVVQSISNNIATLEMPGGALLKARGEATVGQTVFVRGGVIEGQAPSLPVELIEV